MMREDAIQREKTNFLQKRWVHIGLIILLTFGVYANSFKNEFVWDDEDLIVNNNFVKNWKNFPGIFSKEYFTLAREASYRPICTLSFFIDYSLWKLNVFGWHLTNVSFHTANAVLIYFLVSFIFSHSFTSSLHLPAIASAEAGRSLSALITALLFALHPIQTEAVNGISFREDLISFFFFLLAFLLYIKSNQLLNHPTIRLSNKRVFLYSVSCISFIFALFSKEMAITLPFVLILYDYCFTHYESHIQYFMRKYFGYFLITGLYLLGRIFLFKPVGLLEGREGIALSARLPYPGNSFYLTIITMTTVVSKYLELLLLPIRLSIVYDDFPIAKSLFAPTVLVSIGLLLFLLLIVYSSKKEISFPILYFLIILIPVSNIVPFGAIMAERYLYFSSLGFCLFLTTMPVVKFAEINPRVRKATWFLIVLVIGFYSLRTIKRNGYYRDNFTLWLRTVKISPNSESAHFNLGLVYSKKGLYDLAIAEYKRTIEIEPRYASAYYNLGLVYHLKGWTEQALIWYQKTLKINLKYKKAYNNLGTIYHQMGWYEEAIAHYKKALEIDPNYEDTLHNLKIIYALYESQKNK